MASVLASPRGARAVPARLGCLRSTWVQRHAELGAARRTETVARQRWEAGSLDDRGYTTARRTLADAEERELAAWHRLQATAGAIPRCRVTSVGSTRARRSRKRRITRGAAAVIRGGRRLVAGSVRHPRVAGSMLVTGGVAGIALLRPVLALTAAGLAFAASVTVVLLRHRRRPGLGEAGGRFAARVQQAMVDVGLARRGSGGGIEAPRLQGRPSVSAQGNVVLLRWSLPAGLTLGDVLRRQEDLGHRLCAEVHAWFDRGSLHTEVLRAEIPTRVDAARFYATPRPAAALGIGIGEGRRGPLFADLARVGHLLIGGMSQQGKSVFQRQMLTYLALDQGPDDLRLLCLDFKGGVELDRFGRLPHALRPTVSTLDEAVVALDAVRRELDRRTALLVDAGVEDLGAWHAAGHPRMPRILVCTDELAQLTATYAGDRTRKAMQEAATSRLIELAQLGRAAGLHLAICTQRPASDAVPGALKANLDGKVAFRTANELNSRILLESDRAALLPPDAPGRGIWQVGARAEEFQAPYLSAADSRRLLEERWGPLGSRTGRIADGVSQSGGVSVVGDVHHGPSGSRHTGSTYPLLLEDDGVGDGGYDRFLRCTRRTGEDMDERGGCA